MASSYANATGGVEFSTNEFSGARLPAGFYRIEGTATDYQTRLSTSFEVAENEVFKFGNLPLTPNFPVRFSEVRPCGNLPAEGGICRYSARVNNASRETINGAAWSLVDARGLDAPVPFSTFQTGKSVPLSLERGTSSVVQFRFTVPADAAPGSSFCPQLQVGEGSASSDEVYYQPLRQEQLFCISKSFARGGGFLIVTGSQGAALAEQNQKASAGKPRN